MSKQKLPSVSTTLYQIKGKGKIGVTKNNIYHFPYIQIYISTTDKVCPL